GCTTSGSSAIGPSCYTLAATFLAAFLATFFAAFLTAFLAAGFAAVLVADLPAAAVRGVLASNSKPTLPWASHTRKALNLRLVRLDTNPSNKSVLPVSSSLVICCAGISCCRITLPVRKSHDLLASTDFSQT